MFAPRTTNLVAHSPVPFHRTSYDYSISPAPFICKLPFCERGFTLCVTGPVERVPSKGSSRMITLQYDAESYDAR